MNKPFNSNGRCYKSRVYRLQSSSSSWDRLAPNKVYWSYRTAAATRRCFPLPCGLRSLSIAFRAARARSREARPPLMEQNRTPYGMESMMDELAPSFSLFLCLHFCSPAVSQLSRWICFHGRPAAHPAGVLHGKLELLAF